MHDQVQHQLRIELDSITLLRTLNQDNKKEGIYGFDSGKRFKGRKHPIVLDSQGLLIGVLVADAPIRSE